MSVGTIAMLGGLFIVPLVLLRLGHRLRRRTPALRGMFWGALIGYCVGACAAVAAGMIPASEWSDSDTMRGALGFWALIIAPVLGALGGMAKARRG